MTHINAGAVIATERPRFVRTRRFAGWTLRTLPLFVYMFVIYVAIELLVPNVRATIFSLGSYALAWVEVIYLLAIVMAMAELLRVSKPGIDNTREALRMMFAWVGYLVLFVLGATGAPALRIFNNTEFLMLLLISLIQVVLAFMINARTLKRTIDNTQDNASPDHYHQ